MGAETLWRIGSDTPDYTADDLGGIGAERSGGRWNRKGTRMVYASTSRALACLETLVHLGAGDLALNRYLVVITVAMQPGPHGPCLTAQPTSAGTRSPPGWVSLDLGTAWAAGGTSLLVKCR